MKKLIYLLLTLIYLPIKCAAPGGAAVADNEQLLDKIFNDYIGDLNKSMTKEIDGEELSDIAFDLSKKANNPDVKKLAAVLNEVLDRDTLFMHIATIIAALKPEAINPVKFEAIEQKLTQALENAGKQQEARKQEDKEMQQRIEEMKRRHEQVFGGAKK